MENNKEKITLRLKNKVTKKWQLFEEIAFSDNKNWDEETKAYNDYIDAYKIYEIYQANFSALSIGVSLE